MKPNVGEGLEKERDGINLPLFLLLLPLSKNFKRQNCMDRCKDNCTYGHTSRETQKKKNATDFSRRCLVLSGVCK